MHDIRPSDPPSATWHPADLCARCPEASLGALFPAVSFRWRSFACMHMHQNTLSFNVGFKYRYRMVCRRSMAALISRLSARNRASLPRLLLTNLAQFQLLAPSFLLLTELRFRTWSTGMCQVLQVNQRIRLLSFHDALVPHTDLRTPCHAVGRGLAPVPPAPL